MLLRYFIAPVALTVGLFVASAASAQTMVGEQSVSSEDMQAVQRWCDALAEDAHANPGVDNEDHVLPVPDEVDEESTAVELSTITLDQCLDAGLVEGPLPRDN